MTRHRIRHRRIGLLVLAAATLALVRPVSALVSTLSPASYTTTGGSDGGQPVGNLAVRDQSGTQNDFNKYVEFTTPAGVNYQGYRSYLLPSGVAASSIRVLLLTANFMGPAKVDQAWTWSIYNWTTGSWIRLGDNMRVRSWVWRRFVFRVPRPFADYAEPGTGEIRIRLESNSDVDDADLDYEALMVISSAARAATPTRTPTPAPTPTPTVNASGIWRPALNTSWQIQFGGLPVDQTVEAQMYDIDLFDNDASIVAALHAQGRKVVCYLSAGSWENWRPDAGQFPAAVLGSDLEGWPGEKWLDIRQLGVLGPLMEARLDQCKAKGFDGVDPDNVDGYTNNSGFPLSAQDQLAYNRFLANAAHARGLSIGLKNDLAQVNELVADFDWQLNEQCFQYNECNALMPFITAGKPVFNLEYNLATSQFCAQANALNFNSLKKRLALDAYRVPCR
ncbi:MAG: endo alpha-1,4 polygalactosaminidase [Deltaproteobacteria bacterium]|nr:endo alpha-1,4 polygalactosaminidase [Deltaproteobacteria bacterium]